ncbi:hypothetical protein C0Z16_17275 [Paraburkholderia rhynchosiae]|uniref:Uncharacterized protein n=1 Tax=Paraburkholderia rhynchosiae TaxID=487049 RepID=A0ABX4V4G1_9BURK|nr:hypothetical protein C0Z16_17275 [Paraburkholderia rhynchosiae]
MASGLESSCCVRLETASRSASVFIFGTVFVVLTAVFFRTGGVRMMREMAHGEHEHHGSGHGSHDRGSHSRDQRSRQEH